MSKTTLGTIVRFVVSGGINTGSTFVLYWLLLFWMSYSAAYAVSFATGIALSYVLNTRFVFKTDYSLRKLALFPMVYLTSYLAGAVVLHLSVTRLGVDPILAPFISICSTLPLTYLLTKAVLADHRGKKYD